MKSKKQKKNQKEKEQIDNKLQDEIMSYLSKNETLIKTESESEKEMKQIKEENEKYLQDIKSKSTNELFDEIVKALNNTMQLEKEAQESQNKIVIENENIKTYYLNAQTVDKQYNELDAYNKTILQKIKEISEDKIKIAELEESKTKEMSEQCEKFKKEFLEKFNTTSCETIQKNNDELAKKLDECMVATQKIKETIETQHDLKNNKKMDLESILTSQITDRLNSLTSQSNDFKKENEKLHNELEEEEIRRKQLNEELKKKTRLFENQKKKYEKIMRDLISIQKENNELKRIDAVSMKKEIEKNQEKLEELVKKNKELQSKIKELKELKQKRDAEKATDINTITSSDNKEEEKPKEENKDK